MLIPRPICDAEVSVTNVNGTQNAGVPRHISLFSQRGLEQGLRSAHGDGDGDVLLFSSSCYIVAHITNLIKYSV